MSERSHNRLSPQQELLLEYLRKGRTLSNQHAVNSLGIQSVSRRITELIEMGFDIIKEWKQDHFGNRYVVYKLNTEEEE